MTGPETATSTSTSFTHTMSQAGTYQLTLTVANAVGSDPHTETITVSQAVEPPDAGFSCTSTSLTEGDQLDCTWSGTGGTPDTFDWSLTGPATDSSTGTSFTRTMSQPGSYQLTLTVTNAAGTDTSNDTITVSAAPDPPQITSLDCETSQTPAEVGDTATCVASTSGTVDRLLWSWRQPDGVGYSRRPQQSVTHTLPMAGEYFVTVAAQGAGDETSESTTIAVQDPPPEPPQITGMGCHSPGGLGNEDPPVWFGGQVLTCNVTATGDVDSYDWTFNPGGVNRTGEQVQFGLPGQDPGERTDGRVEVTVSGPGGLSDSASLDFIIRACDNHPDPPCNRM